ncbi:hypothetical protein F5Y12DRAFT_738159, partial [Xylaria sp. FL1777]
MYHFSARPLTFAIAGSGDSGSAKGHRKRQKQRRRKKKEKRHTTPRIRWSSPTQLLIRRSQKLDVAARGALNWC